MAEKKAEAALEAAALGMSEPMRSGELLQPEEIVTQERGEREPIRKLYENLARYLGEKRETLEGMTSRDAADARSFLIYMENEARFKARQV